MIQRIQSLYLFLSAVFMAGLFLFPLAQFADAEGVFYELTAMGLLATANEQIVLQSWPLFILFGVIILLDLVSIFLYKKRKLQMRFCVFNILLMIGSLGLIYFYFWLSIREFNILNQSFYITSIIPLFSALLTYLAFRGIWKDELLIRSIDRIR